MKTTDPFRNIPTRVGKAADRDFRPKEWSEHPHSRGESLIVSINHRNLLGTSPLAWGKHKSRGVLHILTRNIPTRVGKAAQQNVVTARHPEHPHSRGESLLLKQWSDSLLGTSPLAWGKPVTNFLTLSNQRNIPTRVGKALKEQGRLLAVSEHPHSRGESFFFCSSS